MSELLLHAAAQGDRLQLTGAGHWVSSNAHALESAVDAATRHFRAARQVSIDMQAVERLDTFGGWLLERLQRTFAAAGAATQITGLRQDYGALIDEMHAVDTRLQPAERGVSVRGMLDAIGHNIASVGGYIGNFVNMLGALIVAFARLAVHPRRFRLTAMVHQLDNVSWRAVPIILLITFLIGCIIAQQGIFHFSKFGAEIYVVDMVGILVLREIGVLIVCIMVAGRSGSAYTAELGAMKMREEIDALHTMGFDPVEVLVVPRIVALMIGVPILTFLGSMAALYGGGVVAWLYGGIAPDIFLSRLREAINLQTFAVGMIKAPFMALVIGIVSCVAGLKVQGSAESLGLQTTASVVESIFLVIVLDGLFAIFFASIGM